MSQFILFSDIIILFCFDFLYFPQLHSNISRPIYVLPFSEIFLTVFIQECLSFAFDQVSPEKKKKFPRPLTDEYLDRLILFKGILPRPLLSAGSGELTYRKDSKKAFSSESRAGLFIVIKVHCFHINLHSFWHTLFDRDSSSVQDHLLRQYTGQASLTATISFL